MIENGSKGGPGWSARGRLARGSSRFSHAVPLQAPSRPSRPLSFHSSYYSL